MVNVLEYLSKNWRPATQEDVDLLFDEDRATYDRIASGEKVGVTNLMAKLRNKVRTRTRAFISDSLDLLFDGPVPGASGQTGTLVQYATYHTQPLVAKINTRAKLDSDVKNAFRVFGWSPPEHTIGTSPAAGPRIQWPAANIPSVMPILAVVKIPRISRHRTMDVKPVSPTPEAKQPASTGREVKRAPDTFAADKKAMFPTVKGGPTDGDAEALKVGASAGTSGDVRQERMAIICPAYVMSVDSLVPRERVMSPCSDVTIANVALCVLAAIKAFDQVGLIHADIKPGNLMLNHSCNTVVLIDFGSAVEHGQTLIEHSPLYSLCVTTTTVEYDLACLAAVLFELGGGNLICGMTVDLVIARSGGDRLVDKLVKICLDASISAGKIDTVWKACRALCEKTVGGRDGFTDVERIWPDSVSHPVEGKGSD
jgi:hypothetical protein